ncbi:hypothetical protein ABEB36_006513 [Hypothenemus hampei]|uniref:Uncharacterized protein n=1 Tax=Hypothenemus hampei TaxID=57062 RepID=A0ABD1ERA2_HYPHA
MPECPGSHANLYLQSKLFAFTTRFLILDVMKSKLFEMLHDLILLIALRESEKMMISLSFLENAIIRASCMAISSALQIQSCSGMREENLKSNCGMYMPKPDLSLTLDASVNIKVKSFLYLFVQALKAFGISGSDFLIGRSTIGI